MPSRTDFTLIPATDWVDQIWLIHSRPADERGCCAYCDQNAPCLYLRLADEIRSLRDEKEKLEQERPARLTCGHTMDAWYFYDEGHDETGSGECAVCALKKMSKQP